MSSLENQKPLRIWSDKVKEARNELKRYSTDAKIFDDMKYTTGMTDICRYFYYILERLSLQGFIHIMRRNDGKDNKQPIEFRVVNAKECEHEFDFLFRKDNEIVELSASVGQGSIRNIATATKSRWKLTLNWFIADDRGKIDMIDQVIGRNTPLRVIVNNDERIEIAQYVKMTYPKCFCNSQCIFKYVDCNRVNWRVADSISIVEYCHQLLILNHVAVSNNRDDTRRRVELGRQAHGLADIHRDDIMHQDNAKTLAIHSLVRDELPEGNKTYDMSDKEYMHLLEVEDRPQSIQQLARQAPLEDDSSWNRQSDVDDAHVASNTYASLFTQPIEMLPRSNDNHRISYSESMTHSLTGENHKRNMLRKSYLEFITSGLPAVEVHNDRQSYSEIVDDRKHQKPVSELEAMASKLAEFDDSSVDKSWLETYTNADRTANCIQTEQPIRRRRRRFVSQPQDDYGHATSQPPHPAHNHDVFSLTPHPAYNYDGFTSSPHPAHNPSLHPLSAYYNHSSPPHPAYKYADIPLHPNSVDNHRSFAVRPAEKVQVDPLFRPVSHSFAVRPAEKVHVDPLFCAVRPVEKVQVDPLPQRVSRSGYNRGLSSEGRSSGDDFSFDALFQPVSHSVDNHIVSRDEDVDLSYSSGDHVDFPLEPVSENRSHSEIARDPFEESLSGIYEEVEPWVFDD